MSGGKVGPLPQPVHQRLGLLAPAVPLGLGPDPRAAVGAGAAAFGGLGDVIGPGGGEERIVVALPVLFGNIGGRRADESGEQLVEPPGAARGGAIGGAAPIKPGEVGEQQPAVVAPPPGHLLAMIEHRLLDPVERALGQHLLGMIARQHQRRIPPGGEMGRAAAADIDRLRRDADRGGGIADRAAGGERLEEAGLAGRRKGAQAPLPAAGRGVRCLPLPPAGGGWGEGLFGFLLGWVRPGLNMPSPNRCSLRERLTAPRKREGS